MSHRSVFRRVCLAIFFASALFPAVATAQGSHMGGAIQSESDFGTNPPTAGPTVAAIIAWAGPYKKYEAYGPPFSSPTPPLPPGVTYAYVRTDFGIRSTNYGGVLCVESWKEIYIRLEFTDGSAYIYQYYWSKRGCTDGTLDLFEEYGDSSSRGDTGSPDTRSLDRSWLRINLSQSRKRIDRIPAGHTLDLSSLAAPLGGPGWDVLEITAAPGGILDLTGNAPAVGPVLIAGAVVIRCDTILLDPGVSIADLVQGTLVTGPALLVRDPQAVVEVFVSAPLPGPGSMDVVVRNHGNAGDLIALAFADDQGWVLPGQVVTSLAAGRAQRVSIPFAIPAGTPAGAAAVVTVQAISALSPGTFEVSQSHVMHDPAGVFHIGQETPGCAGPHDFIATGSPTVGNAAFALSCHNGPPFGVGYWLLSLGPAASLTQLGIGVLIYLDFEDPTFAWLPVLADPAGEVQIPIPLPPDPILAGIEVSTQIVFIWPSVCQASGTVFSGTAGLRLVVLP